MTSERVFCCFKNLKVDPNGPKILAANLNKILKTTTFDVIEEYGATENECELECSRDEVDYIRQRLPDLVTSRHRSIWFTYRSKASDYTSEINQFNSPTNSKQKNWKALYNFGSMIGYDRFIRHILSNRSPVLVKVYRDTRGRLKNIVLDNCHTKYRMVFDMNLFHNNVLIKYGQDSIDEPIKIVFMMKGLPQIKKPVSNRDYIRICDFSQHKIDMNIISQCSDLYLQFDQRSDAKDFLGELSNTNGTTRFIYNYADFQFDLPSNDESMSKTLDCSEFSSKWGSYSMEMLTSLGFVFTDKYLSDEQIQSTFISHHRQSPERFYDICCALWFRLREDHCYPIGKIFNDPKIINLRKNSYQVPHALVTPLRILFQPMHSTSGHRAMRKYDNPGSYRWMLVYFRDEDQSSGITNISENVELRSRYKSILQNGLPFRDQNLINYYYFGSSGSQLKKQEFWFLTSVNKNLTDVGMFVGKARSELGDLKKIQNVATYIARVGLYLTTSKPTDIKLKYVGSSESFYSKKIAQLKLYISSRIRTKSSVDQIEFKAYLIEDIERNGYCFTDGVGTISLGLAKKVAESNGIHIRKDVDIPSAYQVRVAGCKGMLSIDPSSTISDYYIKVRKSMMKFTTDDWTLEIVDHSRIMCLSLNNQIIRLLYDLNPENQAVFESLQNRCTSPGQWHPPEETYLNIFDSMDVDRKKDEMRRQGYINAKDYLRRNKIPLPVDEARSLFGIADETKSLQEGQCFIRYQTMDGKSYKVVTGEVLVTKNPCLYPGDIRRLQAVDIPALHPFIRDCIVFPVLGRRPHSNEIAGSDLDGDQYWVYWGKELKIKEMMPPLAYMPAEKKSVTEVTQELMIDHTLDTFDDRTSGIICNTHSVIADRDPNGTKSVDCIYLANLFPRAIDSIKTGEQINMERVDQLREKHCHSYPTWMMKDDKSSYKNESINGRLFEKAQNLQIDKRVYRFLYRKYDKIKEDISINMGEDNGCHELCHSSDRVTNFSRALTSSKFVTIYRHPYRFTILILSIVFFGFRNLMLY